MKKKHILLLITLLIFILALTACSGRSMVASGWAGITADEETAYIAFGNYIYAINLSNGTQRWKFPAEADAKITFYATPSLTEDGQLIAGGYNGVLYSLNPQNGQVNWTFENAPHRFVAAPLVTGKFIYAPSTDHNLYAFDLKGAQVWGPFETEEPIWSQPSIDHKCECIYLTSMDHKVYSLDANTGNLRWATDDLGGAIVGSPTLSEDDILYIGTFKNEMLALNANSGEILWRYSTEEWVWAGPAIDENNIYFGDLSGTFYALDRKDGTIQWQLQPGGAITGTPLVSEEGIIFGTENGFLISVSTDGTINWNLPFSGNLYTDPIAAGDIILAASNDPTQLLIAIDPNGVQKWSFGLEK
jgi:outer membrane protein assembly factor BamB